ncbi:MAG: membrane protein insertion efficiency factor YidD [Desulfobacteraceae bacterium]|nr:membrane protein insertion efficiency factor YidD [Desulfobacteraceae bacterium]
MKKTLIIFVKTYQYCISPFFAPACRFYPTCSVYAISAIEKHGSFKGFFLAVKRILKCHPFHPGGFDPIP